MKRNKVPESASSPTPGAQRAGEGGDAASETARRKIRYMSAAEPKVREPQGTIAPAPGAEPETQNMRIMQGVAQGLPAALAGLAAEGGLAKLAAKWAKIKMKDQAREKIRETYGLPNNRSHAEDLYQKLATLQFLRLDPASQAAFVEYDPTRPDKVPRELRQANGAGYTEGPDAPVEEPVPQANGPVPEGGPRIVINPTTFRNRKDALCVAWNERLRIWMEQQDFKPRSEPTPEQRDFFADTPYANDEVQMRRTILARIATLDTSVQEPTREQVSETLAVLQGFGETETPETRREADDLARLTQLVDRTWSYPGSEDDLDDELTETEAEPADRRTEETGDLDDELGGMEPEPGDLDDLGDEMSEHDEDLDNITGEEI